MGLGTIAAVGLATSPRLRRKTKNLWNDVTGKTAATEAAKAQKAAADEATRVQKEMFDKNIELNEPWRNAGLTALSQLQGGIDSGAFNVRDEAFGERQPGAFVDDTKMPEDFYYDKFRMEDDPGYQFRRKEALQGIEHSAATRGGLFSGSTLKSLSDRAGLMASEEAANSYGRYSDGRNFAYGVHGGKVDQANMDRGFKYGQHQDSMGQYNINRANFNEGMTGKRMAMNDRFSRLATLAGFGESGTARMGSAAGMYGQQAGDNAMDRGNAQASGIVGGYNTQRDFVMGLADLASKMYGAKAGAGAK